MPLSNALTDSARRAALIRDAAVVLDDEVASKSGLRGRLVKATFKVVKGMKPGFIPQTIDALLDDFVKQMEPFYERWSADGQSQSCPDFFAANGTAVADALLSITDQRAQQHDNKKLVGAYNKLRPMAKGHVTAAMPRIGALIERHTRDLRS